MCLYTAARIINRCNIKVRKSFNLRKSIMETPYGEHHVKVIRDPEDKDLFKVTEPVIKESAGGPEYFGFHCHLSSNIGNYVYIHPSQSLYTDFEDITCKSFASYPDPLSKTIIGERLSLILQTISDFVSEPILKIEVDYRIITCYFLMGFSIYIESNKDRTYLEYYPREGKVKKYYVKEDLVEFLDGRIKSEEYIKDFKKRLCKLLPNELLTDNSLLYI
jgi:hypothetical protein